MPQLVPPMLARLSSHLPAPDDAYAYELKWDGIRAIAFLDRGRIRLQSRNLLDLTLQYPELQPLARALRGHQAILDGEIVALSQSGAPSFELLQKRLGLDARNVVNRMSEVTATYMIFDLLHADGRNLMPLPYTQRREKLAKLKIGGSAWQTTPWRAGGGAHVFETSRKFQFEGIVAKRLDSPYEPGSRNGAWIKIKNVKRQEFVIGGWTPGEGRRTESIGALLAGYYDLPRARAMKLNRRQKLIYAGKIGTGFSDSMLSQLQQLFRPLHADSSPFESSPEIPRRAQFVRPRLVGEVEFTEWTQAGILRHPSFKGLRTDKDPRDIIREEPID